MVPPPCTLASIVSKTSFCTNITGAIASVSVTINSAHVKLVFAGENLKRACVNGCWICVDKYFGNVGPAAITFLSCYGGYFGNLLGSSNGCYQSFLL